MLNNRGSKNVALIRDLYPAASSSDFGNCSSREPNTSEICAERQELTVKTFRRELVTDESIRIGSEDSEHILAKGKRN